MNSFKVLLRRLSLVCLCMEPAWAEFVGPPAGAAGVVEKEIQREYSVEEMSPDKEVPLLEIDIPQKTLHVPLGKPVFIQSIQIEGNSLFGTQVLEKIWGSYLGKELTGQDVQEVCRQVQQFYVEQGYILARVYPPVQEIQNNTLTIKVLEGVLSQISIEGNQFYKEWYIRQYFSKLEGKPVNYHSLMKALLLVNENTDLWVGAVFTKGAEVGLVHLVLMVKDSRPIHIYGDYNNWGSNITTYSRVGARLDIGNAATSGDKLSVIGVGGIPFKEDRKSVV